MRPTPEKGCLMPDENPLIGLFKDASRASPVGERTTPGFPESPQRFAQRAASMRTLSLGDALPAPQPRVGQAMRHPSLAGGTRGLEAAGDQVDTARRAVEGQHMQRVGAGALAGAMGSGAGTDTIRAAMIGGSRCLAAGSRLISLPMGASAYQQQGATGNAIALREEPGEFVTVEAATFTEQNDPLDETPEASIPAAQAEVLRDDLRLFGVRYRVPRRARKIRGDRIVADELMLALAHGLGPLLDGAIFDALEPATLDPYDLEAAAARGLYFSELRALVGTDGTSAASVEGRLFAEGIHAELTDRVAETVIGAWDRAAVVVADEVSIVADRLGLNGDLQVTAWIGLHGLAPDKSRFWKAVAL